MFSQIIASMNDLCFDLVGMEKEKRDPKTIKSNEGTTYTGDLLGL